MLFKIKEDRVRKASPFGHLPGWGLVSAIVKVEDDLRQESFALQLVHQFKRIFDEFKVSASLFISNLEMTYLHTQINN